MVTELSPAQKFPSGTMRDQLGGGEGDLRASPLGCRGPIVLLCPLQGVQGDKQRFPSELSLWDGFLLL